MPISIRLPEDVEDRLDSLAKRTGRSKTFYVTQAIRAHLDDLEDLYLAEQRLVELQSGQTKAISLDELLKRHGLEN